MTELTARERACLEYLSDKMEATAEMIGEAVASYGPKRRRDEAIFGEAVARGLHNMNPPLTGWVPDLQAWQITVAGRAALANQTGCKTCGSRGYVVEDGDYQPLAVKCPDCGQTL